ncbi:phosphotransferase enzyme family protein [Spirosoma fluminis]
MQLFPAQYSTLSASALRDSLEKSYGFQGMNCRLLLRGVSDTYVLEGAESKYVFKVYRNAHRSLNEIKGEVELLNILKGRGANVSYPIRDRNGQQIQAFNAAEGVRHGVLFSYAIGENVYDLSDNQLRVVGREMAFNHTITSQIDVPHERKPYTIETTLTRPLKLIEPAFADYQEGYAYLTEIAQQVIKKMESFDTSIFSVGYCHYDYLPKNFHFDQDDTFTLFDFDFAGKGFLVNDLTSFLVHFFFHSIYGKISKEEADRQFNVALDAYREVRPLSDEEVEAIPYLGIMFWVFYLGFAYENFDDWSNTFFGLRYLRERVGIIKRFAELYCRF